MQRPNAQYTLYWIHPPAPSVRFVLMRKLLNATFQPTPKSPCVLSKLSLVRRTWMRSPSTPTSTSWNVVIDRPGLRLPATVTVDVTDCVPPPLDVAVIAIGLVTSAPSSGDAAVIAGRGGAGVHVSVALFEISGTPLTIALATSW